MKKGSQGFEQNTWTKNLNKKLEQKTWTKNLNRKLEHNTKRSGFKFNKFKYKGEKPFNK